MPAYLTVTALRDSLVSAGGAGARTAGELPTERLQYHVNQAQDEILGRLSRNYVLVADDSTDPPPPTLLVEIMGAFAGYGATLEYYGSQAVEERDPVVLRYTRAKEQLALIAKGDLVLPGLDDKSGGAATGEPAAYGMGPTVGLADDVYADPYGHTYGARRGWGGVWL